MGKLIVASILLLAAIAVWRSMTSLASTAFAQRRDPRLYMLAGRWGASLSPRSRC